MSDPVLEIRDALARGELDAGDLTTRALGRYLGKSTSVLYHHYGSLDGFLFAVSQAGHALLGKALIDAMRGCASLEVVAEAFVRFGLDAPGLYAVMFERHYDWDALRAQGAFEPALPGMSLWTALIGLLAGAGSSDPETDARILYAGLHGLVSLALSGRADVGATSTPDRDVALVGARRLARRMQHHGRDRGNDHRMAAPASVE